MLVEQYVQEMDEVLLENYINTLYEGIDLSAFKDVFKKMGKEISNNFKFIGTFGMVITLFFPIVDNLIKNMNVKVDLTPENIVLATVGAVAVLLDSNKDKLKWVLKKLEDKQWDAIIYQITETLKSIKEIFAFIAKQMGTVIKSFADMLSYTLLFVPMLKLLLDFVQTHRVNPADFSGVAASIGAGVAIIAGKNILEVLINQLSKQKKLKLQPMV